MFWGGGLFVGGGGEGRNKSDGKEVGEGGGGVGGETFSAENLKTLDLSNNFEISYKFKKFATPPTPSSPAYSTL